MNIHNIMNILDTIKSHLYYDYLLSGASVFLNESSGFHDPILKMSEKIYTEYLRAIEPIVLSNRYFNGTFVLYGSLFPDSFFDRLVIKSFFIKEKVVFSDVNGCYLVDESGQTEDGYTVAIYVSSSGQDGSFRNKFICFMCHELTHAYEDYCEFKSTGRSYMKSAEKETIDRSALTKFFQTDDKDIMDLYSLIQYTLKSEQNAEQASFASEIMLKRQGNLIGNYSDVVGFFHDTEAYRTLEKRELQLESLKNINDPEKREMLAKMFNSVYVGSHRNYNEIMNFLTRKFNERKHRLIKIGSKSITKTIEGFVSDPLHFHIG